MSLEPVTKPPLRWNRFFFWGMVVEFLLILGSFTLPESRLAVEVRNLTLADHLKSLGMAFAFSDAANFSGIDGTANLYLSDVFHQAFMDVNETGTEATAMTFVMSASKSVDDRFIVDHPFVFLIRDHGSGGILFLGRILDPTK